MARFRYVGRTYSGKKSGVLNAPSRNAALQELKGKGIRIIEFEEVEESIWSKDIVIGNAIKLQDYVIFLRQFATLIRAGVTIIDSIKILTEQTESKMLKKTLQAMEQDLREGISLSSSAKKHERIFTPMFVNLVEAGELGGNMEETLERLATHFEKQHYTQQKIKSALSYPLVVGLIALVAVIFLLTSVVPTFVDLFDSFGSELPPLTKFVLSASDFMQSFWWLVILLFIGIGFGLYFLKSNPVTKYYMDYILFKLPIFGKLLRKSAIARMTRTLSSLFSSSVPIFQSLTIVQKVTNNEVISKVLEESKQALERGESLTEPMKDHWVFPPLVTQMMAIGENTGSLDEMLSKVADFYEKEVDTATDQLKSIIEPLMIVVLAGIVGLIVASILIPMFEVFNHVG